jgi:7-cyano-7-deazaguanine synthase in queuosine biosynthesis
MACGGCERRGNKLWAMIGKRPHAAVLFSGGLDSAYTAWHLAKQGYEVHLYHNPWRYKGSGEGEGEIVSAQAAAKLLGLPLLTLGSVEVENTHNVMRVPTLGAMLICHRALPPYKVYAYGGHPSTYELDAKWVRILQAMCDVWHPGSKIQTPADGKTRKELMAALPKELISALFSCYKTKLDGARCGKCDKCLADKV